MVLGVPVATERVVTSLFGVAFTDLYIRLCAMGIWTDARLI